MCMQRGGLEQMWHSSYLRQDNVLLLNQMDQAKEGRLLLGAVPHTDNMRSRLYVKAAYTSDQTRVAVAWKNNIYAYQTQ